jgi:hypothetical protein
LTPKSNDFGRVQIVGPATEHPLVVDARKAGVGAADHGGNACFRDRRQSRLNLRAGNRPYDPLDPKIGKKFGEREHCTGIRAGVVFDAQLDRAPQYAARLLDFFQGELQSVHLEGSPFGVRPGQCAHYADLDGFRSDRARGKQQRRATRQSNTDQHMRPPGWFCIILRQIRMLQHHAWIN